MQDDRMVINLKSFTVETNQEASGLRLLNFLFFYGMRVCVYSLCLSNLVLVFKSEITRNRASRKN